MLGRMGIRTERPLTIGAVCVGISVVATVVWECTVEEALRRQSEAVRSQVADEIAQVDTSRKG
jgi:hypothetical protein